MRVIIWVMGFGTCSWTRGCVNEHFGLFLSYRLVEDTPDGDDFYVGMKMRKDMISCVLIT
jgi:hypothetical protein